MCHAYFVCLIYFPGTRSSPWPRSAEDIACIISSFGFTTRVLLRSQGLGDVPRRADGACNHCTTTAHRPNTCLWDHLGADTAASLALSSDRPLPVAAAGNSYTRA